MTKPAASPALRLCLYGGLEVLRDGEALELPQSKKTMAVLAYLAMTGKPQRREHLCELLWNIPADPRASLRWSLNRLRLLLGPNVILADRNTVALHPGAISCDRLDIRQLLAGKVDSIDTDALETAAALVRGEFLDGFTLSEAHDFSAWCVMERGAARQEHVKLLGLLVARLTETPDRAIPYAQRLMQLEPGDEEAHISVLRLLHAAGRRKEAAEHVQMASRQYEAATGHPAHQLTRLWGSLQSGKKQTASISTAAREKPQQRIHFCKTEDDVRLAYSVSGQGTPIIKTANWLSNLDFDLESPIWLHLMWALNAGRCLIRYDQRGCGLSDANPQDVSFEGFGRDLKAVVDAAAPERFDIFAISHGCAVAVNYAATHPERVRRLILIGGMAQGWRRRAPEGVPQRELLVALAREGWGLDTSAFRQVFTSLMFPSATPEQAGWFNDLQRKSSTPQIAARILEALGHYDVTPLLAKVKCPTLVLHSIDDALIPFALGRELAAGIPGAQFVSLPSRNHIILEDEPSWPTFRDQLQTFLTS